MLLIVEGMDRCGKTTLVEQLRKKYFTAPEILVHHSSSPPKVENPNQWEVDHYGRLFDTAHDLVKFGGFNVIFDRFHLGAIVYGAKYRNADPDGIYEIDINFFNRSNVDTAIVLLTDYPEAICSRDDGASLENSTEEYEQTRNGFIEAFGGSRCRNKFHINITDNGGFQNTFPAVVNFLNNVRGENAESS